MTRLSSVLLVSALGFSFSGALPAVRADDAKKTPEQKAQEKKDADLKKAKDEMEKDLKSKKIDPVPALAFLDKLANQVGLDVPAAKSLTKKVMDKKIPWDQANAGSDDKLRASVDSKTNKIDTKKYTEAFTKWITDWKPADPKK
jgi:hypothetical protein